MERKTMTVDEIRNNLHLTKQGVKNYLNLGVLNPVAGTENSDNPLYYTDEVATIREAITTCQSSLLHLNAIRDNVLKEIDKANAALTVLKWNNAIKEGEANSIIDSIALFIKKALPQIEDERMPLTCIKAYAEYDYLEEAARLMENNKLARKNPQEFCNELYHKVEGLDVTSMLNCFAERKALIKERDELKEQVNELNKKIAMVSTKPEADEFLSCHGLKYELSEKQVAGIKTNIMDCGFSGRILNGLYSLTESKYDREKMTLEFVVAKTKQEMKNLRNFGQTCMVSIEEKLAEYDLTLGMKITEINGKYYCR